MKKHTKYGFTIVELLIVIVVIAVLAAITVVAFNGIQARAQFATAQAAHARAYRQTVADKGSLDVDVPMNECSGTVVAIGGGRQATVDPAIWSPNRDPAGGCGFYYSSNTYYGDIPIGAKQFQVMNNVPKDIQNMKLGFMIKHADDSSSTSSCVTNKGGSIFTIGPGPFVKFMFSNTCTVRVSTQASTTTWSNTSSWVDSSKVRSKVWTAVLVEVTNQTNVKIYINGKLDKEGNLPNPLAVPTNRTAHGSYGDSSSPPSGHISGLFVSINGDL